MYLWGKPGLGQGGRGKEEREEKAPKRGGMSVFTIPDGDVGESRRVSTKLAPISIYIWPVKKTPQKNVMPPWTRLRASDGAAESNYVGT